MIHTCVLRMVNKKWSTQGPDDFKVWKKCPPMFLLRVKFATKWVFIEVLNLSNKLYRDNWNLKRCKQNFINLEVIKNKHIIQEYNTYTDDIVLRIWPMWIFDSIRLSYISVPFQCACFVMFVKVICCHLHITLFHQTR